jgi:hypothetical protein
MTAFNVVRFRVREGMDQAFLGAHRDGKAAWPGLTRGCIIKTGAQTYILIGEWPNMAAERPDHPLTGVSERGSGARARCDGCGLGRRGTCADLRNAATHQTICLPR